jgi:HEAT repeat protein
MRIARLADLSVRGGFSWSRNVCLAETLGVWLLLICNADADGCFVFHWNKQLDINEPTQKAIILHYQGREDLVLQVKYEGPAEEFGWLIPVPGLPDVKKGSMDCFYEVSRLTQERFPAFWSRGKSEDVGVKVIQIKTVGAYEVAVLSATNAAGLGDWLDAHNFAFPKEKQAVLDGYVKKQWYFVAAKIDPDRNGFALQPGVPRGTPDRRTISPSTRKKLANGELHPLVISFSSEKCVFPLAISSVNRKPSELSLYLLSSEPLTSRAVFDKKFADCRREATNVVQRAAAFPEARAELMKKLNERTIKLSSDEMRISEEKWIMRDEFMYRHDWPQANGAAMFETWADDPTDPPPPTEVVNKLMGWGSFGKASAESEKVYYGGEDLVQSMEVGPKDIPQCSKELPRLVGKSWWLTKLVEVVAPEEMRDLEFEPAVPILAGKLGTPVGLGAAICLSHLGGCAVPTVLAGLKSSNPVERRSAAYVMVASGGGMKDSRLAATIPGLFEDADARIRLYACQTARLYWDAALAPRLRELLGDEDSDVRWDARYCLGDHWDESQIPIYRKIVEEDGPAAPLAFDLLHDCKFSREQLVHFFCSTNAFVVSTAFLHLRDQKLNLTLNELEPILTNSQVEARIIGLRPLALIGNREAVDRLVALLRDPNEVFRWMVRARLHWLTGQSLGSDPAAWEKWWAENKNDFTPLKPSGPPFEKR